MKIHELKTDKEMFCLTLGKIKSYELRYDDRKYKLNDKVILRETQYNKKEMKCGKPLIYTGREIGGTITHILKSCYGLKSGWVILQLDI